MQEDLPLCPQGHAVLPDAAGREGTCSHHLLGTEWGM